jgi:hypothetical protein
VIYELDDARREGLQLKVPGDRVVYGIDGLWVTILPASYANGNRHVEHVMAVRRAKPRLSDGRSRRLRPRSSSNMGTGPTTAELCSAEDRQPHMDRAFLNKMPAEKARADCYRQGQDR